MSSDYVPGVRIKDHGHVVRQAKTLRDFFSTPVEELFPSRKVLTCNDVDTLDVAFKRLIDGKVLSLPVWSRSHKRYTGLIDVVDFVTFIHQHFSADILRADDVSKFLSAKDRFTSHTVGKVCNLSERNPWYPVEHSAPLLRLLETVCRHNIHRVPVVEGDGELFCMLSQSDLVALVAANIHNALFVPMGTLVLRDARIGTWGAVHSVAQTEPALVAFEKIAKARVQGVAVVDDKGLLVSNISASDLRLIESEGSSLSVLYNSCSDFIQLAHGGQKRLLSLSNKATFAEAVLKMHETKAHRLYIVDEAGAPEAVISQVDLLRAVEARVQKGE